MAKFSTLLGELKRRNVFRVAVLYLIASWLILQIVDVLFPALKLPEWTITFVAAILIIGKSGDSLLKERKPLKPMGYK
jgi:hypothetical protein